MSKERRFLWALLVTLLVPGAANAQQAGTITADRIFDALDLREGMTVCEMGAGDGELSIAAARRVGSQGRVLASELGDGQVQTLRQKVANSATQNIIVVSGDTGTTNFPDAACDALFMRNVYHHFANPPAINASIASALKAGGRLAIVDFTPPPGHEAASPADRGNDGMHGITAPTLSRELRDAGFEEVASEVGAQRWFMVVVSKSKLEPCERSAIQMACPSMQSQEFAR
jgi:ubiquinone/menaquinone biosynthesis C-methylase UbiE